MINPKFQKHLTEQAKQTADERPVPRYGVISSYDPLTNTATVVLSAPDSDQMHDIVTRVECPVYPGLQNAGPEPGRPCWVVFNGSKNDSRPMISHYFNHDYNKRDYYRHSDARTGISAYLASM